MEIIKDGRVTIYNTKKPGFKFIDKSVEEKKDDLNTYLKNRGGR